jgi:prepilin-type N-terminal cleavage/methylation domain-containing protein
MTRSRLGNGGWTLVELLVALVIFAAVIGGALSFLRSQGRLVDVANTRMNTIQNLQFALATMEQRLRAAGANMPEEQPALVYGGPNVVSFNADYVTKVANDPFAVYYDPDAPSATVDAIGMARRIVVPNTSFAYPDTSYLRGGFNSAAETITFFLPADSTTSRTDDYLLLEKINDQPAELVARNILGSPTTVFFQYYRLTQGVNGALSLDTMPTAGLPLSHAYKLHLAPLDTGRIAIIDSVRAVRITFTATNGLSGPQERRSTLTRVVNLPNAGIANKRTCGEPPLLGTGLSARAVTQADGTPAVELTWGQATDESGGEKDVVRYVLWRVQAPEVDWGTPYLSIPAGSPSYIYADAAVTSGQTYRYLLAAQDCTPSLSTSSSMSGAVTIP